MRIARWMEVESFEVRDGRVIEHLRRRRGPIAFVAFWAWAIHRRAWRFLP